MAPLLVILTTWSLRNRAAKKEAVGGVAGMLRGKGRVFALSWAFLFVPLARAEICVPVYEGAQKTLDLLLSEEDFLPWIKRGVEFFAVMAAKKGIKVTPEAVRKVLGNLKEVRAVGYILPAGYPRVLLDFYEGQLSSEEGWRTNLWLLSPDGSSAVLVKSRGRLEEVFVLLARTKGYNTEVVAVRTKGMVDLGALFELLSSLEGLKRKGAEGKGKE